MCRHNFLQEREQMQGEQLMSDRKTILDARRTVDKLQKNHIVQD